MVSSPATKWIVGGLLAALVFAVFVWLVRSEGQMAREAIRSAATESGKEVHAGMVDAANQSVDHTLDRITHLPGEILGLPQAAKPRGSNADSSQDVAAEPPRMTDLLAKAAEIGHHATKAVDDIGQQVLGLSTAEEIRVGKQVHRLIGRQFRLRNSGPAVERLRQLAAPLLEYRTRKEIPYSFLLVESPEINAFSHLGGYVYVNQGLIAFVRGDAELQFVLGHEIAHVDLKHCSKRMTYAARVTDMGGQLSGDWRNLLT